MSFPAFFDQVPAISLRDPLADFLGSVSDGVMEYRYGDAVRLAGHSCPTVAGAYLTTCRALAALYGEVMPVRGEIRVELAAPLQDGVTGVVANVAGLITGAAGEGGFKGLAGRFSRRNLLLFSREQPLDLRFSRSDGSAAVDARLDLSPVPPDPAMAPLLQSWLGGNATPAMLAEFRALWQDRVRRILVDHWDDPELLELRRAA